MAFLKQHRKATLELNGRILSGSFRVSLTNERDREAITEFMNEMRKQVREFNPNPPKPKARAKKKVKAKRKS